MPLWATGQSGSNQQSSLLSPPSSSDQGGQLSVRPLICFPGWFQERLSWCKRVDWQRETRGMDKVKLYLLASVPGYDGVICWGTCSSSSVPCYLLNYRECCRYCQNQPNQPHETATLLGGRGRLLSNTTSLHLDFMDKHMDTQPLSPVERKYDTAEKAWAFLWGSSWPVRTSHQAIYGALSHVYDERVCCVICQMTK